MNIEDCLELRARDIFFRKLQITDCEMRAVISHPHVYVFLALATAVFVAFDAANLWSRMAVWQVALIWLVTLSLQVILFHSFTMLWIWGQNRLSLPVIFLPLLNLTAYSVTYPVTVLHIGMHTGRTFSEVMLPSVLVSGIFFCLIFEALFFAFVNPLLRQSIAARSAGGARSISIAGEQFLINDILTLRSQEHYVLVTTEDGDHRLRARLGDLVSQTREDEGVLAHRSHWISRQAIAGLTRKNGADVILTHSGEHLPVARPRQDEVRGWIEKHAPHAKSKGMNGGA